MPNHLYLLRHAEAVQKGSHQKDEERELTSRGVSEAVQVATQFDKTGLPLDVIYSSTADRARQTASLLADALKRNNEIVVLDEELYEASARTFFNFITKLDRGHQHVMCVAHNPTITYLAEYITKQPIGDLVTGGMVVIEFDFSNWAEVSEGNGSLLHYLQPSTRE